MNTEPKSPENLRWFEAGSLSSLLLDPLSEPLSQTLCAFMKEQRWFRGKARTLRGLQVLDVLPLSAADIEELVLLCVRVHYEADERDEVYVLPLARTANKSQTRAVLGLHLGRGLDNIVYDPSGDAALSDSLIQLYSQRLVNSTRGVLHVDAHAALVTRLAPQADPLEAHAPSGDQSNTTLFYGQELMLKLFRQLEDGVNPDVEVCRFLWDHGYRHAPEPLGYVQYTSPHFQATLSAVQRYIPSQGTAWDMTRQALQRALLLAEQRRAHTQAPELPKGDLLSSAREPVPDSIAELVGSLAPLVAQLAQRSAELHLCLASDVTDPAFSPEPFDARYQRTIVQAARDRLTRVYGLLRKQLPSLPAAHRPRAEQVLLLQGQLDQQLDSLPDARVQADRIRCHGDYHLGQVLFTANDFVIIDFEGEPAQPLAVRREKHSALYDVCGMLRSFHYAATVATEEVLSARHDPDERFSLTQWSDAFYSWCSALFLGAYLTRAREEPGKAVFLPQSEDQLRALLRLHMLDKCAYELGYELNNRPDWLLVPLAGLSNLADPENR
ncbi:MAG TPA: putative maltokinase [Polyangiales bacterium]|nr:putative maltokinase [Polyangiales bacterium]